MLKQSLILAAGLIPAAFSLPAMAGGLPDGVYDCYVGQAFLGDIRIDGDSFAGPAFDGNYEGSYPFEVTDSGTVYWGGPLGGMSTDGNTVVATVVKDRGKGRVGFDITLQNSEGNFQSVGCDPQ